MNNQRRRADDFTDSLNSFRQTINEQNQNVSQTYLEDSLDLDSIRNGQFKGDNHNHATNESRPDSIILAGNFASQQCISDLCKTAEQNYNNIQPVPGENAYSVISDETSYFPLKPDLNKCINLFHNKYLKEYDTPGEHTNNSLSLTEIRVNKDIDSDQLNKNKIMIVQFISNRPRAMSSSSLKNVTLFNVEIRKCKSCTMLDSNLKRDTNYNIKAGQFPLAETTTNNQEKFEKVVPLFDALSLSKTSVLKKDNSHSTEENQICDSSSERSLNEELNPSELRTFLQSLEDQKPLEEAPIQEHLLRRWSTNFYDAPRNFTEKLLTIIEESVINNDSHADISYRRLTQEVRKMCKYIEDETAPEWLYSSPGMSTSIRTRKKSQEFKSDLLQKSLGTSATPDKGLCSTTLNSPRHIIKSPNKVYRRVPKNILHNTKSPAFDSTSTFESLEAFCEKLFPNEYKTLARREKKQMQSPLQNMNRILRACENQMASLENSPNVHEQLKQAEMFTADSNQDNTVPEARYELFSPEQCDKNYSNNVPDMLKRRAKHNKRYERIEPDDLRKSLINEIAKKRQRCFDTAKIMMEIDASSEPVEVQEICPIVSSSDSKPSINDAKFKETLICVKKYQDYLEQYLPFFNLIQRQSNISPHDTKDSLPIEKMSNENINTNVAMSIVTPNKMTLKVPKFSTKSSRKKSTSPSSAKRRSTNKVTVSKPRLFVTPGKPIEKKTANINCKPKRTYFPNLMGATSKQKERNISPHAKNIYRQIGTYDHVISPVGSYIRGTDPRLMKNLRPKTDEMLLTPRKQVTASPSPKPRMKFRLSPKQPKESLIKTPVRNENVADNFIHPKVNYKLPSHVRTIKETENLKVGNRANELLRSMKNKVVIRHEGRTKSVQRDCAEQPEIHYDSEEESVHIEQTARKTYFSRVQKNY